MSTQEEFVAFPKIARLSRDILVTEKIDGTNAQILIRELEGYVAKDAVAVVGDLALYAGSRSHWVTPEADNFGFARWVKDHAEELAGLGPGRHFGEWWGCGIQRRYDLKEKRFSLFDTSKWETKPACCHVVPTLYKGPFSEEAIQRVMVALGANGSVAAPGFMRPEGIVIYHIAARVGFKKTFEKDDTGKEEGS